MENKIVDSYDKWLPILNNLTKQELEIKFDNIIDLFKRLKAEYNRFVDEDIMRQPLSLIKVNELKEVIRKQWESSGIIKHVMLEYKLIENKRFIDEKNSSFKKIKVLDYKQKYVDQPHLDYLGGYFSGHEFSEYEDFTFYDILIKTKQNISIYNDYLLALDNIIDKRLSDKLDSTIIFLDGTIIFQDNSLTKSDLFVPSWKSGLVSTYYKGKFTGILTLFLF